MRRTIVALVVLALTTPAAAQQGPPPTPVPPAGSPSPFPQSLETPPPSAEPPDLSAASAILVDLDSGRVLHERKADARRAVASTTKVMTALLTLESTHPEEAIVVNGTATDQRGSVLGLRPGEGIQVRDLLFALMLQSANDAAVALAEHVSGSVEAFVEAMNARARRLGARDTRFASPNGLDDAGSSTARDLATITIEAYSHPLFARIARTRVRTIPAPVGPARRIQNRNALLWLYPGAMGVKTGSTSAAGFCLVAAAERDGLRLLSVVLGSAPEAFTDSATLLDHGFTAYERRVVIEEGEELDLLPGGPAVAGATLEALVQRGAELVYRTLPPEGDEVARVEVLAAGEVLGEVPLLAAESPEPEPAGPPAWWASMLDSVAGALARLLGIS